MPAIIRTDRLTKRFGDFTAVDNLSFEVQEGEIFGFLGPNGAGKSTTIAILTTLLMPTSGTARVNGWDVTRDRDAVRRAIGIVFQDPSLDDRLTAEENLRFHARLYGVPAKEYSERLKTVLNLVELWDRRNALVRTFSGGMKRRLEIARGLIHYPRLLFLDEPTLGLDPQTRAKLWDYILDLRRRHAMTIFMTTHYMNEAEYCDRIAIVDRGRLQALDTPTELKHLVGDDVISLVPTDAVAAADEIKSAFGLEPHPVGENLEVHVTDGEAYLPKLLSGLKSNIKSVTLREPTIEDVFLKLTGRGLRDADASATDRLREHRKHHGH
ncbi:MAG: ATP-binding cassette domain-containing protein [Patescibacteria group bacterium]|nr:ATP-binding cassette domain-containing protein [Patescibacteria group bacterium]